MQCRDLQGSGSSHQAVCSEIKYHPFPLSWPFLWALPRVFISCSNPTSNVAQFSLEELMRTKAIISKQILTSRSQHVAKCIYLLPQWFLKTIPTIFARPKNASICTESIRLPSSSVHWSTASKKTATSLLSIKPHFYPGFMPRSDTLLLSTTLITAKAKDRSTEASACPAPTFYKACHNKQLHTKLTLQARWGV